MPDEEALERRLRAVERTLTDGDHDVDALHDAGALAARIERLETDLEDATDRIAELEAATQALRGYVGNVKSVNEDVERRADAALAAVERFEADADDAGQSTASGRQTPSRPSGRVSDRPASNRSVTQRTGSSQTPQHSKRRETRETTPKPDREEASASNESGQTLVERVRTVL